MLRSPLVVGSMAAIRMIIQRDAKTKKERWIQELVGRRGMRCATAVLANKNVRTAYAVLTKGTEYKAGLLSHKEANTLKMQKRR